MREHLGIVELATVCEQMRTGSLVLFEALGGWVATTDEPALQRLFATACHRHAWHAELWADRRPAVAELPVDDMPGVAVADASSTPDRAAAYRGALVELHSSLTHLSARVEPELDPSTRRVVDLVVSDVDDLLARLDAE